MHVRSLGHLGVNPLQEVEKFGRPVTFVVLADHRASRNVESGEQGCRAIADIGMGAPFGDARRHGQNRLLAIQCLDLRFLIHAQHDCPVRRLHVKPDYVLHLIDEERITQCIRGTHGRSHAETSCFGCSFQGDRELTDGSTEVFQEVHLFNRVVVVGSESNPMISRELGKAVDDIDRVGGTQWPTLANGRIQARKPPLDDIDRETETHLAL